MQSNTGAPQSNTGAPQPNTGASTRQEHGLGDALLALEDALDRREDEAGWLKMSLARCSGEHERAITLLKEEHKARSEHWASVNARLQEEVRAKDDLLEERLDDLSELRIRVHELEICEKELLKKIRIAEQVYCSV